MFFPDGDQELTLSRTILASIEVTDELAFLIIGN